MTRSPHTRWFYRAGMILVALVVPLRAKGWAADETAPKCCDQSSMECNTGQSVGDKGSCPGSQVCVQFVDKCKKKSPGVLCMCGDKTSSLELSSTSLTFTKKSRRAVLTVSNSGNVALDLAILESGATDAFDVRATRRCKSKISSPAQRQGFRALGAAPTSTATVPPQGCVRYRLRFTAKQEGVYSELLDIQSDAVTPPPGAIVTLIGSVGKHATGSSTTSTTSTPSTSTTTTTGTGNPSCTGYASPAPTFGSTAFFIYGSCTTETSATIIGALFGTPLAPLSGFTASGTDICQISSQSGTNNYYSCTPGKGGGIVFPAGGTRPCGYIQAFASPGGPFSFTFYINGQAYPGIGSSGG